MVELRADVIALIIMAALISGCIFGLFIGYGIGFPDGFHEGMKDGYYLGASDQEQIDNGHILGITQSINGVKVGSINETAFYDNRLHKYVNETEVETVTTIIVPECNQTDTNESGMCITAVDAITGKPINDMKYTLTNTSKATIIIGDSPSYYNTTRDWGIIV